MSKGRPRQRLLEIASHIRKAREELSKAEEALEGLLEGAPTEAPAPDVDALAGEVAEAVAGLTRRGVPQGVLRGEGTSEWAKVPSLRDALIAAAAQTVARSAARGSPSTAARVLAVLLEEPAREFKAAQVARRAGCSEGVARTTLGRLVQQGHAGRTRAGAFRAG